MNILLADDDNTSRESLRRTIATDPGHDLTEVYDGEEAWTMLREAEQAFDLAIIELTPPRNDALRLVERIRSIPALRQLPIILCTTATDRPSVLRAAQLGVRHYVVKPYAPDAVLEKIRSTAAEKAARVAADPTAEIAQRLSLAPAAVTQLITALYAKVREWLAAARQAQTPQEFTRVTIDASALRSACANLGLRTLGQELELVETRFNRNYCEQHGDMLSPSRLEVAEELKGVDAELGRIAARFGLSG